MQRFWGKFPGDLTPDSVDVILHVEITTPSPMWQHKQPSPEAFDNENYYPNKNEDNNIDNRKEQDEEEEQGLSLLRKFYKKKACLQTKEHISFMIEIYMGGIIPGFDQAVYEKASYKKTK